MLLVKLSNVAYAIRVIQNEISVPGHCYDNVLEKAGHMTINKNPFLVEWRHSRGLVLSTYSVQTVAEVLVGLNTKVKTLTFWN